MFDDLYNLKWKHFSINQDSTLADIFTKNHHPDVTLVSDDKVAFRAHKFVLGAGSPVLKDLLLNNPHVDPMIFLKGVKSFELNLILQFIYLGKTQFFQSRMEKFFETGRELQIKQLSHPLTANDEVITRDVPPADDNLMKEDDLRRDHS